MTLYEKLDAYGKSDYYAFHMPGHKRNVNYMEENLPFGIDITEIEGFDDLHHCEGILKDAQTRAASVYGAEETHFLVNGSTVGILSALAGCTRRGDEVLIARNCHKSVYHAVEIFGMKPVYIYPKKQENEEAVLSGCIDAADVEQILEQRREIRAVMIVSPSYDGVVSDIKKIAGIVHKYGIPLIVDEAHGAHFGFHDYFPENANRLGADIVIHSVHKTLPSLTQTALLHMNGSIVDRKRVERYLHILQSSSPSYVLMAGIDACIHMLETRKDEVFGNYAENLDSLREKLRKMTHLKLCESTSYDRSKIVISTEGTDWSSRELSEKLFHTFHLQMEMTAGNYILAMTSVADTKEGFDRLEKALLEIDKQVKTCQDSKKIRTEIPKAEQARIPCWRDEVSEEEKEKVRFEECAGRISLDFAYLYPPGCPIVVPGERISARAAELLCQYRDMGFSIEGTEEENRIGVWING